MEFHRSCARLDGFDRFSNVAWSVRAFSRSLLRIKVADFAPGICLRDHLADRGDILGRIDGWKILLGDGLRGIELSFESKDESKILPHPHIGARLSGGFSQSRFSQGQLFR
jgi:hypothetical protein